MGMFDTTDPNDMQRQYALLGLTSALAQAAQPTRIPLGIGAVLGMAGQGALQGRIMGQQQGLDMAAKMQALQEGAIKLKMLGPQADLTEMQTKALMDAYKSWKDQQGQAPPLGAPMPPGPPPPQQAFPQTRMDALSQAGGGNIGLGAANLGTNPAPTPANAPPSPPPMGAPPPPQQSGFMGLPGLTPQMAMLMGPQGIASVATKFSEPQNLRPGGSVQVYDYGQGKYNTLGYQPVLPQGAAQGPDGVVRNLPGAIEAQRASAAASKVPEAPAGFRYEPQLDAFVRLGGGPAAVAESAAAQAGGAAQGALPAKLKEIEAQGAQSQSNTAFTKGLDIGTNLVDAYDPATGTTRKITQREALGMAQGGAPAQSAPPVVPAKANPIGPQPNGSFKTPAGTIIPAAPTPVRSAGGLQAAPSAADAATQASYAPIIKGWQDSIQPAIQAEQRFQAMSEALKATQSGAWNETKQTVAQKLMSLGIINADTAGKMVNGSVADAQVLLKNNFQAALATLSAARLGRITQNEIFAMQKNMPSIGLQPEANQAIIAQGIGVARYQQALANDWNTARQMGYSDPLKYEEEWSRANPLQKFIEDAKKEVGPLKGMQGAPTVQDLVNEARRRGLVQ